MSAIEMMLTAKQPVHHGYRPVHDLPTPPRSSPPLSVQDSFQKPHIGLPQQQSPSTKPMSAPHRGLPLPAAMTLPQPPPPAPGPPHPPAPGPPLHSQGGPVPSPHSQALGALPAPPQHPGSEESMRSWLIAKAEEERRKQEEEKTRQESLRLEQRKLEYDMLRTSLDRGIPPPMVPVVFAGMSGGTLPQAALEWAQQYLMPQQGHPAQILPPQGTVSPEHRRESSQYGAPQQYGGSLGVPSTPGTGPGAPASFVAYQGPGSPTRPRAHTLGIGGAVGRPLGGSALPRLNTGEGPPGPPSIPHPPHLAHQAAAPQQETQSPSIYFHHWQPPNTQGGSNQPGTPSVESPKKRKATGPQQAAPPPSQRFRSPPPMGQHGGPTTLSNPPPGRRRGHSRQRSDISSYRGRGFNPHRGLSPSLSVTREAAMGESSQHPRSSAHSVSSLLSDQPSPRYTSEIRAQQQSEGERRNSPATSDDRSRGGIPGGGSAAGPPGSGREND